MSATINTRTTLHKGRVVELVSENITLENGVTTDMEFVHHPGATAIVPMLTAAKVILIRQYRHALGDYIWEIPAGTLDPEESAMACAQRELVEETGYAAQSWHQLGEITPVPGYSDERICIYLAQNMAQTSQNLDEDELVEVHIVDFDEAIDMIHRGKIQDGKTIAGLFLADRWLN
jgi:ADP-ribose pyrophosphatase